MDLEQMRRRLPARVSQERLARAVGCSLQHYSRIERGLTVPDPALCVRLAEVFIAHGARIDRARLLRHFHPVVAGAFSRGAPMTDASAGAAVAG